jgi:hypothetical protein
MEIGSLCLNPRGYLNSMTALAHRVAIGKHEVFLLTQLEKGIPKSCSAFERCLASCGRGETSAFAKALVRQVFELLSEAL